MSRNKIIDKTDQAQPIELSQGQVLKVVYSDYPTETFMVTQTSKNVYKLICLETGNRVADGFSRRKNLNDLLDTIGRGVKQIIPVEATITIK